MGPASATDRWIALVDDDESIRRSFSRALRVRGIEVQTFKSAEDYLDRAHGTPACLCLDLYLGAGMNGFELAEHLRARSIEPPIIFFTGHDARESEPMMRGRHNSLVILRKPFEVQQLLDRVLEHLRAGPSDGIA
jgi:two-component system response regulator FixJ